MNEKIIDILLNTKFHLYSIVIKSKHHKTKNSIFSISFTPKDFIAWCLDNLNNNEYCIINLNFTDGILFSDTVEFKSNYKLKFISFDSNPIHDSYSICTILKANYL